MWVQLDEIKPQFNRIENQKAEQEMDKNSLAHATWNRK